MENSALLSQPSYLLIIASVCILGGIALFMYSILKREHDIQTKEEDTFNRYHKIINNAHNEARAIIDTTSVASTGILAGSRATSEHMSEDLDKVLQSVAAKHIEYLKKSSDDFNKSYDDKLIKLQEQLAAHTEQSIKDSEKRLNESLEKYMQPIVDSTNNSHTIIEKRTQELINQVEKELADYKQARTTKIEAEVKDLVTKTFKDVLRKAIPESLQEELILESLEKAKTEGGISL
jgi:hypothetical protein